MAKQPKDIAFAQLERDGVIFRSTGDSEVVLHALHRWGPERAIPTRSSAGWPASL